FEPPLPPAAAACAALSPPQSTSCLAWSAASVACACRRLTSSADWVASADESCDWAVVRACCAWVTDDGAVPAGTEIGDGPAEPRVALTCVCDVRERRSTKASEVGYALSPTPAPEGVDEPNGSKATSATTAPSARSPSRPKTSRRLATPRR